MKTIVFILCFFSLNFSSFGQDSIQKVYNNKKQVMQQGGYLNGKMHGEWRFWSDSTEYYLSEIKFYDQGRLHGTYVKYYSNGKMQVYGQYSRSAIKIKKIKCPECVGGSFPIVYALYVNKWEYFDETGKLIREEFYSTKGRLKKKVVYK